MHSEMSEKERNNICPRYPFKCEGCPNVKDPNAECTLGWIKQRLARDTDQWIQKTFKGVKK